ncbi:hypothetical protein GWC02_15510 [Listeria monocytogenes]|nr:hypothetical protein [Listeria monocytogenes]EDN8996287.1 hypothetical protein [Listeria monocytogenes]
MSNSENYSLKDIAIMYRDHFVHKVAIIHVKDKMTPIKIRFDQGHLAHLIGLHKFDYKRGEQLYHSLLEGKITWDDLKRRNMGSYRQYEYRMKYIIYLKDVIDSCRIAVYDGMIRADLMLYDEKGKRFLSLGIHKEKTTDFFVPTTFIENKYNKFQRNRHIVVVSREMQSIDEYTQ